MKMNYAIKGVIILKELIGNLCKFYKLDTSLQILSMTKNRFLKQIIRCSIMDK